MSARLMLYEQRRNRKTSHVMHLQRDPQFRLAEAAVTIIIKGSWTANSWLRSSA